MKKNNHLKRFRREIQNNCSSSGNRETFLPAKPDMLLFQAKLLGMVKKQAYRLCLSYSQIWCAE